MIWYYLVVQLLLSEVSAGSEQNSFLLSSIKAHYGVMLCTAVLFLNGFKINIQLFIRTGLWEQGEGPQV